MNILGIDIGRKNYAYCLLCRSTPQDWHIGSWGIVEIFTKRRLPMIKQASTIYSKINHIISEINSKGKVKIDRVVIESQPGKNNILERILSHTIAYFYLNGYTVTTARISYSKGLNYRQRKKESIDKAIGILKSNQEKVSLNYLFKFKKKDDLCDSFLLAYSLNKLPLYHVPKIQSLKTDNQSVQDNH